MKKNYLLMSLFTLCIYFMGYSQNGLIGSGFGTNGWNIPADIDNFTLSAGGSRIATLQSNGTGNSYFRLVTNWDGNNSQYGPLSTVDDYLLTIGNEVPSSEIVLNSTSKAYYIDANVSYNYVFKTKAGGNPPASLGLIVFEIQGVVRTVSSATTISTTYPGQTNTITATLDGALSTGQGVYLRYTTDNFANSTVVEMTGTGTSYTADIPAGTNTAGANVSYYLFTSGSGLTISPSNADFYTINLNNNGGPNYNYTVSTSYASKADGDWSNTNTWMDGDVPDASKSVVINHNVTLDQNQEIASLVVNSSLSINSGISFKVNGTYSGSGTVTYNRNLGNANWYLISSPVSGQAYNDAYADTFGLATGTVNTAQRGIATYTTSSNTWAYLLDDDSNAGNFTSGIGYSVRRQTGSGDISFTGAINTSDVSVVVSSASNGFNLIGNPFTSHLQSDLFLAGNTSNLVSQTLWAWNQGTSSYDTYVTLNEFDLAPAQGFFVRSSNGTNLNIAESYQALTGGTFQKSARTEVKLLMNDGSADRFAKMYYLDNATKGFDNGFDGETFGGVENSVDVFTNLLENNEGKKYQIQSLPIAEMETMIVPVGVKADAGKEITFTAEAMNLPGDTKVFLEDRLTNTITRLDEANSSYKVTLNNALNGTGRFYLHTKASGVLSTDELALSNTSVYATANNTLRVVGLPSGNATVKVFTVLGKQVVQTSFSSTGSYDVSLPKLATGMYIVQLETATGKLNKKIVLE
ncbi:T9SS type A sorting domain-containing protein [Polaribacter sp. BAL334]|uniref:T9SS type A sorting domain-containing protein n=1 Tax=Polaribacter sp. BAL334 TaxID=1708178 RepID=UPI0018D273A2|nr:T9SS type A sorting domain-containing protein [Polaribacter sp. BAL334]MBG7613280.1 T9SS type A sorting domain-containing protein [Polaribacter sp. BAL334]